MTLVTAGVFSDEIALGNFSSPSEFDDGGGVVGDEIYEIFSGSKNKDPLWLESVKGLRAARERMKAQATDTPGPFFVFCTKTS